MHGINAYAIFCEDVREEVAGGYTIVGAMRDNLAISSFPATLPKLGIFIRIYFPLDSDAHDIRFYMVMSTGERTLIGGPDMASVEDSIQLARADNAPKAGLIVTIVASPFPVKQPSRASIEFEYNGEVSVIGWVNFKDTSSSGGA